MEDRALTHEEARERAALLSDLRYDVALDLAGREGTFGSRTRVRFGCRTPGARSFVDLVACEVVSASLNGTAIAPEAIAPGRVELGPLAERNVLEVHAVCRYGHSGVGLHRFEDPADGGVYLHTHYQPFDAHRVFACFDQPDMKGRFRFAVRAPDGWVVVSNSPVAATAPGAGTVEWRFAETPPLPTYVTAVVAGHYRHVRRLHAGVDLGLYFRATMAPYVDADEIFDVTTRGLDYFARVFGRPYPFGRAGDGGDVTPAKYDQVFAPEFNWGGMENAGCVTYRESYLFRSRVTDAARASRAGTLLHELAHMWFGNLVTMRWWDDLWLNESFATYMGYRCLAEATRFTGAWVAFATDEKEWALRQDQLPTTHPIAVAIADTDTVRTNFDGITYAKGAAVLKQLVAWVGDDAFFAGLRDYFARHAHGCATLADFLDALERSSGRALGDWAAAWLETAGVTTLRPELRIDGGRLAGLAVVQEAPERHPTLRSHRLRVDAYALRDGVLAPSGTAALDVAGARTAVSGLAGGPRPDLVLLDADDDAFAKVRLDARSLGTLARHLSGLGDALARARAWGAAWDMTRDAELPARAWVRLVTDHAGAEPDPAMVSSLLERATLAVDRYGDPAGRAAARAALAAAARAALERSTPGGDHQLLWLRHLVAVGDGDEHRLLLLGLLDGTRAIEGVAVDTELRWLLVQRLAGDGVAAEELITAELERDATDIGMRRAATARAGRPAAGAKEHAFSALIGDRELPLAMLGAVAAGFWQPGQDELLLPYAERFGEALASAWRGRVMEEAVALTRMVFPRTIVDPRVLRVAEAALEGPLPAAARRLVTEAVDGLRRALRARVADRTLTYVSYPLNN